MIISPKPIQVLPTSYIAKNSDGNDSFSLPGKLENMPKELTAPAKAYANLIQEPVMLKDMYVYKTPEYLLQQ